MDMLKDEILGMLRETGGFLPVPVTEKAEKIQKIFNVRKKEYVDAVKQLATEGRVETTAEGIKLKVESTASGRKFRQIRRKRR